MFGLGWIATVAIIAIILLIVTMNIPGLIAGAPVATRDPKRLFTPQQRLTLASRAGGQCENVNIFQVRCKAPGSHADHVWPHSLGGATKVSNGAWLCRGCNLSKSGTPPTTIYLINLQISRRKYYPKGVSTKVNWVYSSKNPDEF